MQLSPTAATQDVLVNQRAQQWLAAGHLATTHADLPFDRRLAAIAADLPAEIQEKELGRFLHEMDTMRAAEARSTSSSARVCWRRWSRSSAPRSR